MSRITPMLRKLNPNGTLLTFGSAMDNVNYTNGGASTKKMNFSKFALLRIPDIITPSNGQNNIQFGAIEGAFTLGLSTASPAPEGDRVDLAQSLQNYLMNMETMIIGADEYDATVDHTVSERLFFKWLKEIGAIRFTTPPPSSVATTVTTPRYVEEVDNPEPLSGNVYERVVKYIGDIDIEGSHRSNSNVHRSIYIYVPAQCGNTPVVLYKTEEDVNYHPGQTIKQKTITNIDFIQGRSSVDNPSPAGLDVHAFYDMQVPLTNGVYVMNAVSDVTWFSPLVVEGPFAYFTDIVFTDIANDEITRTVGLDTISFIRSRLDGIGLDLDQTNYAAFQSNALLKGFADFNATDAAGDFSFNAIAVYHDYFDSGTPENKVRNLYGILFLDDLQVVSSVGARIPLYNKIKPSQLLRKQGDSFAFTINLREDANVDDSFPDIEVHITPYQTFATDIFATAMERIAVSSKNLEAATLNQIALQNKISALENSILSSENINTLTKQLQDIKDSLSPATVNANVLSIITNMQDVINQILKGNTSVNLTYNLNFLGYDGLKLTKENDVVKLRNLRQKYSNIYETNLRINGDQFASENVLELKEFDNLFYHLNNSELKVASGNIYIYINDTNVDWSAGQSITVSIQDPIDFRSYAILFYTDAKNKLGLSGKYQKLISALNNITIQKPSFEIVCVDPVAFKFIIK